MFADCCFSSEIQCDQKVSVAPDYYNTIVSCTETFWSHCIFSTTWPLQ